MRFSTEPAKFSLAVEPKLLPSTVSRLIVAGEPRVNVPMSQSSFVVSSSTYSTGAAVGYCDVQVRRPCGETPGKESVPVPGTETRACRQLSQTTLATSRTAARKLRAVFSYWVAIAQNCLILAKKFSIRWRSP